MRPSLVVCFLVALGAVCLASAGSSQRDKRIFGAIKKGLKKGFNTVVGGGKSVGKAVVKTADKAIDKGTSFVKDTAGDIKDGVEDVIDKTDDVIDKGVDAVKDAADDVKDGVVDAAKATAKVSVKVGKGFKSISKSVYRKAYNQGKKAFRKINKLLLKVNFDDVVDKLISMIDSEASNAVCQSACIGSASSLLGPKATFLAALACPPLCKAVLAKIEDAVEKA
ncbi:conotoxin [Elysia marginata]|uniref:Conotoxin n=1 Tax=Elysia marginata TaxID=1093978 RepID=A0AAV4HKV6_9GAST|nr:conotoxin [Elysia marginata]